MAIYRKEPVEVISDTTMDQYLNMPEDEKRALLCDLRRYIRMTITAYLRFCSVSSLLTLIAETVAVANNDDYNNRIVKNTTALMKGDHENGN